MFGKLGRVVVGHPWLVIAAWLAVVTAVIAFSPRLAEVTNSDQTAFLPANAESVQALRVAERAFPQGRGATAVVVVQRRDSAPLTEADVDRAASSFERVGGAGIAQVLAVQSDSTRSVAPNRAVAIAQVQFAGQSQDPAVVDAVPAVRGALDRAFAGTALTARVTGEAALEVDNQQTFVKAERISGAVTVALIVVLLLLIFRSPVAALLPIVSVGLVFAASCSLIALVARTLDFRVGQQLTALLVVVLFGIGTDYLLFLLFRYRELLRAGMEPKAAIVAAVERVGEAVASAAFAVIAAFLALLLATLGFFRTLGPGLAIAVTVMLFAALTLVPAIVTLLGPRVFWPSRSWRRPLRRSAFRRLGALVARRPVPVLAGSLVVLLGLGAGALAFSADYDQVSALPRNTESAQAFAALQKGFPAGALNPTQVYLVSERQLGRLALATFTQQLSGLPGVQAAQPAQLSRDGRTALVSLVLRASPYSNAALADAGGPIRDGAHAAAPPGTRAFVGGQTAAFADVQSATNRDLRVIFPVAGLLFLVILVLVLRSLVAPCYLVLTVVLGFLATLGASVVAFQGIGGAAGLQFIIPIIMYLFVTAIGTDYNILVTVRLREEAREGNEPRQAAALAVEHAGPSVAAAAVILAGTFASFLLTGVSFLYQIGFAVTVGILIVAFVVSLLLVPSVTALVGHAAWWPGHGDRPGGPAGRVGAGGAGATAAEVRPDVRVGLPLGQ